MQKMLYISVLVFLSILFACVGNVTSLYSPYSDPQPIHLTGQIKEYSPGDPSEIELIYHSFSSEEIIRDSASIKGTGHFEFNLKNNIGQDYVFWYRNQSFSFMVLPGDSIHFEFSHQEVPGNDSRNPEYRFSLISDSESVNQSMTIVKELTGTSNEYVYYLESRKIAETDSLLNFIQKHESHQRENLEKILTIHKITDPLLIEWSYQLIDYKYKSQYLHAVTRKLDSAGEIERKSLISDISLKPYNIDPGIRPVYYSGYSGVLNQLFHMYSFYHSLEDSELSEGSFNGATGKMAGLIDQYFDSHQNEVLKARYFNWALKSPFLTDSMEVRIEMFLKSAKNPLLISAIRKKYNSINLKDETIDDLSINKIIEIPVRVDDIFAKILEENKGRIIVLDFWATWCAPCLNEFKTVYPDFIKGFPTDKVEFVFCAINSHEDFWRKIVREVSFRGKHYLLDGRQQYHMEEFFQIGEVPHRVLIYQNGDLWRNDVPGPGEELEIMIDGLMFR